ncbi:hypothetical protein J1605_016885 [Eschrichtius robustus]|uniref:Uncharacterized protein n=1 Tax=Eschrichtius robustus TaxID=9764 RepID=A0AB34HYW9_ESCRO|nr:hypothetical protein J1605_016885 [Eschrichtius robustus]
MASSCLLLQLVQRFDIYRKVPKDLTQPTYTGAIIPQLFSVLTVTLEGIASPVSERRHQKSVIKSGCPRDFPGGAVVENLPANAGDTGSSPGLGRSHMPRSNWAREPQLLSLRVWSLLRNKRGRNSERPAHRNEE